jgi:hypothetical protein
MLSKVRFCFNIGGGYIYVDQIAGIVIDFSRLLPVGQNSHTQSGSRYLQDQDETAG